MSFKVKFGQYALVTGGTSGIGKALAHELAKKQLDLILVARNDAELLSVQNALTQQYSIKVVTISADISTKEGLEKVILNTNGLEVGLLVTAAGLEVNGAFEKNNTEKELQVIELNVISTYQLAKHFSAKMVDRKRGGLLFVASLSGQMPNPYLSNYAGTKAYVVNFAASLHGELKPKGITVSVLSPGLTQTPMTADNGIDWAKTPMTAMKPQEVAQIAIEDFGKKLIIVPSLKNKLMAFMAKHLPLKMQSQMNEKMMRKAMKSSSI